MGSEMCIRDSHNILNLDNIHTRRLPYPNLVKVYQNMCHIMVQNSNIPGSYPRIEAYRHTDTKSQGNPILFRQKGSCHMFIVQKHCLRKCSAIFSWVSLGEGAPATPQRKPIISATGLQNIFEIVEELGERGILKNHIFTGPRCLWGPVYGSRCLSLRTRALVETLLM